MSWGFQLCVAWLKWEQFLFEYFLYMDFAVCLVFSMLSSFWKVLFVKLEPQTLLQMDQNKILLTVKTVHILWSIYTDYKKEPDIFSHSPLFTKWYVCFGFFQDPPFPALMVFALQDLRQDWMKVWRTKAKASFLIQTLKYKPYCVGEQVSTKAQRSLSLWPKIQYFLHKLRGILAF